jgi:uncharacterized protein (TIGR02117 family)
MRGLRQELIWKLPLLALCALILAVIVTARPGDRAIYPAQDPGVAIYVLNNGFHSDIVLPADRVMARGGLLAEAGKAGQGQKWLVYGWGDKGFYTAKGMSLARMADGLRALFRPGNPSVIRVYGITASPDQAFVEPIATRVILSEAGFSALAKSLEASFVADAGKPVVADIAKPDDMFFTSHEHFSVFRLCNNWTSDQLAAAGLPTTPMIDGLAPMLELDLRLRSGVSKP